MPADRIKVTVHRGWVTLEGAVPWQYEKDDAERVVYRLTGVTGVTNLIKVKPERIPSDLREQIETALARSAQVDAEQVTVEVEGSKVILKGAHLGGEGRGGARRLVGAGGSLCRKPDHDRLLMFPERRS